MWVAQARSSFSISPWERAGARAKGTLAMRMTLARVCVGCVTLAVLAGAPMTDAAQQGAAAGEWRSYGGDTGSTKYSPLAQITSENVGDLAVAWRWESADGRFDLDNLRAYYPALQIGNDTSNVSINGLKGTPLMVGDTLYLTTALSQVAAIDAATGETRWVHDPQSYAAGIPIMVLGFSSRGLAYWTDGEAARIIWATAGVRRRWQRRPDAGDSARAAGPAADQLLGDVATCCL